MAEKFSRLLRSMELEEKILHIGVLLCLVSLFFPWLGGQWYGSERHWNGFGFYTGYIGHVVFLIQLYVLAITVSPLLGGPVIVRRSNRHYVRFLLTGLCFILLVSCFTILLRITSEVSGAEVRFGIYSSIIGSVLASFYAFLRYQEQIKNQVHELFRHPDEAPAPAPKAPEQDEGMPPPPPPPAPPPLEDHHLFAKP